jgi:hypothetical protein
MQPSFFDYAMEYQGGKKSTKFLSEMKELIPFEDIEELLIEKSIYKPSKGEHGSHYYRSTTGCYSESAWF